jgi:hypothetical protein
VLSCTEENSHVQRNEQHHDITEHAHNSLVNVWYTLIKKIPALSFLKEPVAIDNTVLADGKHCFASSLWAVFQLHGAQPHFPLVPLFPRSDFSTFFSSGGL